MFGVKFVPFLLTKMENKPVGVWVGVVFVFEITASALAMAIFQVPAS